MLVHSFGNQKLFILLHTSNGGHQRFMLAVRRRRRLGAGDQLGTGGRHRYISTPRNFAVDPRRVGVIQYSLGEARGLIQQRRDDHLPMVGHSLVLFEILVLRVVVLDGLELRVIIISRRRRVVVRRRHDHVLLRRRARGRLPVGTQAACADVSFAACAAHVRSLVRVKAFVQLEVDELSELVGAFVAAVGFLPRVEAHVRFEVGRRRKAFSAFLAHVRFFTGVYEIVLLQMRQLGERLGTHRTLERPLPVVSPQMDLEVGQLAKDLIAGFASVLDLSVFLLEGKRKGFVASRVLTHTTGQRGSALFANTARRHVDITQRLGPTPRDLQLRLGRSLLVGFD